MLDAKENFADSTVSSQVASNFEAPTIKRPNYAQDWSSVRRLQTPKPFLLKRRT